MTSQSSTTAAVWVAIDIAKACHQVLIEVSGGQRRIMRVANTTAAVAGLVTYLRGLKRPCTIAFEPTGDYHRPIMHVLVRAGRFSALPSVVAGRRPHPRCVVQLVGQE